MTMTPIASSITINCKAEVRKKIFINNELSTSAKTSFVCCKCNAENDMELIPFVSGFAILDFYVDNGMLTKKELLENNIVTVTSHYRQHYGELTVQDLPTLYFGTGCNDCHSKYLCVFCCGEKQPGLTLLAISGVWRYELASTSSNYITTSATA